MTLGRQFSLKTSVLLSRLYLIGVRENHKKVSLDAWIQLLGMVGLLGSLVFVGLEMRQSQSVALADTEQQRAIAIQQNFWAFLQSRYDLDKVFRTRNVDELSSGEITARRTNHHI